MGIRETQIKSVLLLGTESNLALPVIRSLGKELPEIKVYVISPVNEKIKIPESSRYISKRLILESDLGSSEVVSELEEKMELYDIDLLIPIEEKYVEFISNNKDRLSKRVNLPPLTDTKRLRRITQKNELYKVLNELGFPSPKTISLNEQELDHIEWNDFPCVIKPVHGFSGYGVAKVNSFEEIRKYFEEKRDAQYINMQEGYVLQEFIPGENFGCSFIAQEGKVLAFTIQQGIEDRGMTYAKCVQFIKNDHIESYIRNFVSQYNFSGIANTDFRWDNRDDTYKMIDFNPRVWSTLMGSTDIGVNFMEVLIQMVAGKKVNASYNDAIYYSGSGALRNILNKKDNKVEHYFDLMDRLRDPLPEFLSLWYRISTRYIEYES
ncbi:ATP-grasp domain-containing protein [Balneola sp. MJW-20]|uniref:ATP-grasp domain-containing protein n=1 Tax=Gracilimonas aurantiaca TaxID=3234185 RepID=UPI003466E550